MRATSHRSIRYPGLPSLARQELANRLDHPELRHGRCQVAEDRVMPRLRSWPADSSRSRVANKSGRAVAFAIVRYIAQAPLLLRQARAGREEEHPHRLADRRRGRRYPSARGEQGVVGELESLDAIRRSLYAPSSGGTEPGEMPSPHAAHRSLESSRRAAPRPRSSPPFHHVRRERRDARRPALLINQTVDIFLDETLVAIDAPSAWTRPFVA